MPLQVLSWQSEETHVCLSHEAGGMNEVVNGTAAAEADEVVEDMLKNHACSAKASRGFTRYAEMQRGADSTQTLLGRAG